MLKNVLKLIVVFIFGIGGGIFADQILWPYFVERPLGLENSPPFITEKKEIIIKENTALQDTVEKVKKSVVGIETKTKKGVLQGSGLIVTSDGLIVALSDLVPRGGNSLLFVGEKSPKFQILKRDLKKNLVLIKIEQRDLSTLSFGDFGKIRLGERVFLVGKIKKEGTWREIVNEGIVRTLNNNSFQTNISEKQYLLGSPLLNIKGEVVGLSLFDKEGKISAISVKDIREFLGF